MTGPRGALHTPLDSLTYVDASASILDWVAEELDGAHGDEPDLDVCISVLTAFESLIHAEAEAHGRRATYSTGCPVHVDERRRRIEPDPKGGPDRVAWFTCRHVCHPGRTAPGHNYSTPPRPQRPTERGTPMTTTADLVAPTIAFTADGAIATDQGVTFPAVAVDRADTGRLMVTIYDPCPRDDRRDAAVIDIEIDHDQAVQLASALRAGANPGHRSEATTSFGEPATIALDSTGGRATLTVTTDDGPTTIHAFPEEAQTLARAVLAVDAHYSSPASTADVWLAR